MIFTSTNANKNDKKVKIDARSVYSQTKSWHFGINIVPLQQQFLPRLFLKAYHGRTSCFIKVVCSTQSKPWILVVSLTL